ncbi:chromatin binding protein [Elasticomyces elasticus]|nr:chromatin binding protein [Elasticomyces elasticus]
MLTHPLNSWSPDGRYLLSSSVDWKGILWDLKDGSRVRTVNFGAPVYIAELHPHNHLSCVAALYEHHHVIADLTFTKPVIYTLPTTPKRSTSDSDPKQAAQDAKQVTCVTVFLPSGTHILSGTTKGWLNLTNTASRQVVYSTRLSNKALVNLRITSSGRDLLVNAADSIVRTLKLPDFDDPAFDAGELRLDVEHRFQDVVNRLSWNHVAFSSSGDYVAASTLMNHDIYIWERGHGSLVKILEGPREEMGAVEWHPYKPLICATGLETGRIFLFSINTPQRWSALAPDFAEVEENVEYVEREDEFDIQPPSLTLKRRLEDEDEDVDVLTIDPAREEKVGVEGLFRMPVLLDIDASDSEDEIIAVGTGQYRRKSQGVDAEVWVEGDDEEAGGEQEPMPQRDNKRRRGD